MFFSIKESHTSRLEQRKKERQAKEAMTQQMLVRAPAASRPAVNFLLPPAVL